VKVPTTTAGPNRYQNTNPNDCFCVRDKGFVARVLSIVVSDQDSKRPSHLGVWS